MYVTIALAVLAETGVLTESTTSALERGCLLEGEH